MAYRQLVGSYITEGLKPWTNGVYMHADGRKKQIRELLAVGTLKIQHLMVNTHGGKGGEIG